MKRMTVLAALAGLLLTATHSLAQNLSTDIDRALKEYQHEREMVDPEKWTVEQFAGWEIRFQNLNSYLNAATPLAEKDAVRTNLIALAQTLGDLPTVESTALAGLADQTTCAGRMRWANYSLGALRMKERLSKQAATSTEILSITKLAKEGCAELADLAGDPSTFSMALIVHHADAWCEPQLAARAARLLQLEQVASRNPKIDLRSERFGLLVDAAKAQCQAGDAQAAFAACQKAEFGGLHTTASALSTVLANTALPLKHRSALVTRSIDGHKLTKSDILNISSLVVELSQSRALENGQQAISWIDRVLAADPALLLELNNEQINSRLASEKVQPQNSAEVEAFESNLRLMRWTINRDVLRNQAAAGLDAREILARYPDHPLRNELALSARY